MLWIPTLTDIATRSILKSGNIQLYMLKEEWSSDGGRLGNEPSSLILWILGLVF
jgi:hypothetical protein